MSDQPDAPKPIKALDVFTINDIAAELLDDLARMVQQFMGVTDGGFAAEYFSGDDFAAHMAIAQIVGDYAEAEFKFNARAENDPMQDAAERRTFSIDEGDGDHKT